METQDTAGLPPIGIPLVRQHELRRIQLRSNRSISGDLLGNYRSAFRGTGLVFTDIREYQPGDDVKHIHWTASARTGKVYVKSYEEDRQLSVVLATDVSASVRSPFSSQTYNKTLDFCALIAGLAQRGNDLLGLSIFSNEVLRFMPPKTGARRQQQVLAALLGVTENHTVTDLKPALTHLRLSLRRPSIIFVLSDFFCPPFEEEVRALALRHDVILVHLQPTIDALPHAGIVSFQDAETGEDVVVDTSDPEVRSRWSQILGMRSEALHQVARECNVDHIAVTSSISQPLIRLMRERALRTRR